MAQVSFKPKVTKQAQAGSSGGSTFGKIAGGLLGAAAIIGTGGAAAPAILGGASMGMGLGGMLGGIIGQDKAGEGAVIEQKGGVQSTGGMQRRQDIMDQVGQLRKAQQAVSQLPQAQQASFSAPINEALARAEQSIQQGRV